jgi:hypothetical protein
MAGNTYLLREPPKTDPVMIDNIRKLNYFIQEVIKNNNKLNLNYSSTDKVKVSANDLLSGTLDTKLEAGTNITLTQVNDGNNESLRITAGGGAHTALSDMPDTGGTNTNHDIRYVTKVQTATPTTPTPYEGMRWYDTDAVANPSVSFVVVTNTYTVADEIELVVCNKTTAFTVTLPVASASGRKITVKNIGAGAVTVDGNSSDTIDGIANQVLSQWDALTVVDYVANAWVIT